MSYEKKSPLVSIIIPVFNEEGALEELYSRLTSVCKTKGYDYEFLFINDGSTDNSPVILKEIAEKDSRSIIINFRKNFGKTAAYTCGFERAHGKIIVTIDSDLQENPEDIPLFIDKIKEGFGMVVGWRQKRKDSFFLRKTPSYCANKLIRLVTGVHVHDYGCSLKAYRADILKDITIYAEMHRFMPALIAWTGGTVTEIPISHNPRKFGKSKFSSLNRTFEVILDLITLKLMTGYAIKPIYFFGRLSFVAFFFGSLAFTIVVYRVFVLRRLEATPMVFFMVIGYLSSIQFLLMGLLAEMLMRIKYEPLQKKYYFIESMYNA